MDITNFIEWFFTEVINIFTQFFNILDSITFSGTSLLKVIVTIIVISVLIPVILTISKNVSFIGSKSERVREKNEKKEGTKKK